MKMYIDYLNEFLGKNKHVISELLEPVGKIVGDRFYFTDGRHLYFIENGKYYEARRIDGIYSFRDQHIFNDLTTKPISDKLTV